MSASDWCNLAAGASGLVTAALVLLAWHVARKESRAKDDALDRYKQDAQVAISTATARSDEAKRDAATAMKDRQKPTPKPPKQILNYRN